MATKFHNITMSHTSNGLKETSNLMEKYTFIKEIGSGSFGKVFLVKSKQQGINYVVKKVDLSKLDKKQSQSASKEVEFLAKLRHNNIVSYKESYEKNNELNIVLEYCENGDLHNKIKEKRISGKHFGENEIFDYFVQISLALEYIHSQKILHRDLKTKNIFLTKGDVIKLGDFGIAKTLENSFELAQTCIGSPFYLSPEICESKPYNKKSDVWALGCVLYEIATLRYAFVAKNVKTLVTKILTGAYSPLPTHMNIHIRSLISCMLKPNPIDRPTVREILEKRFLIKRRAKFICKPYRNDFYKRRSKSGDGRNIFCPEIQKNNLRKISSSCLQLNHQKKDERKYNDISKPQTKYNPLNISRGLKNDKKMVTVNHSKNENGKTLFLVEKHKEELNEEKDRKKENKNLNIIKNVKLVKVKSEYYDLIAGRGGVEKKDDYVGKQIPCDESDLAKIIKSKPDIQKKMRKIKCPRLTDEFEESGDFLETDLQPDKIHAKENPNLFKNDAEQGHRKKWSKNTLQREALLAIFNESELLDGSFTPKPPDDELGYFTFKKTVDDMLSISPTEISGDILKPIKLYQLESKNNQTTNSHYQLLQHEIEHLREKFESNNRNYQIEDLMRFTENSKNILKLGLQKQAERDNKIGESVYYDLECLRVVLEHKIGCRKFSQAYEKMMKIINDELDSALKNSLEKSIDPTKTYVIMKFDMAGDSDDLIKNTWKSIIGILDDKQEYLPDVWELAMSENIYYHL